ncbi:MAG: type VI secretion system baseplate subunit TssF [Chitinophagaceae bacterium]|nr:type VI secretion system baseplate subunit TssF [Chitinophagaceae bacterium]
MADIRKERIRDRMLRTAARIWELPENELETSFDPLAMLLMEACAAELEKIGQDIQSSQQRLIDRLADILVPEAALHGRPSACILQAQATEARSELSAFNHFVTTQKQVQSITGSTANKDLYFTPIGQFRLLKTKLEYLGIGSRWFYTGSGATRETLFNSPGNEMVQAMWLVLSVDPNLPNLEGLSLFFDMRQHSEAHAFYQSLLHSRLSVGSHTLNVKPGFWNAGQFELNIESILDQGMDYNQKLNRLEANIFRNHFLTITDTTPLQNLLQKGLPDELKNQLPAALQDRLATENLVYIRLEPGRLFAQSSIEGMNVSVNAFPVINRKLNTINYRTDPYINIIPLPVEDGFLDIESITAHSGNRFKFRMAASADALQEGEAFVRSTGIGKHNSLEVREIIGNLMEAIRDESAFFGNLSNDFISSRLNEISRILARLEDQVLLANDNKQPHYYLLLKPRVAGETLTIHYWTTNGSHTKLVKGGSAFSPYNHTLAAAQSCLNLTANVGGRATANQQEKKTILKRQLISGSKIISREDVRLACLQIFGEMLQDIRVEKKIVIGSGREQGFMRAIEVVIIPTVQARQQADELEFRCRELQTMLNEHASPVYPFKIVLDPYA